jgi:hypothetical protein
MTGCARAYGNHVLAARFQGKGLVERGYTVYVCERYTQLFRCEPHGLFGNISILFLHVLKYFNKLMGLTPAAFQNWGKIKMGHKNLLG